MHDKYYKIKEAVDGFNLLSYSCVNCNFKQENCKYNCRRRREIKIPEFPLDIEVFVGDLRGRGSFSVIDLAGKRVTIGVDYSLSPAVERARIVYEIARTCDFSDGNDEKKHEDFAKECFWKYLNESLSKKSLLQNGCRYSRNFSWEHQREFDFMQR